MLLVLAMIGWHVESFALSTRMTLEDVYWSMADADVSDSYFIEGLPDTKPDRFIPLGFKDDCRVVARLRQGLAASIENVLVCPDAITRITDRVPRYRPDAAAKKLMKAVIAGALTNGDDAATDRDGFLIEARILGVPKRCASFEVVVTFNGLLADYGKDVSCRNSDGLIPGVDPD